MAIVAKRWRKGRRPGDPDVARARAHDVKTIPYGAWVAPSRTCRRLWLGPAFRREQCAASRSCSGRPLGKLVIEFDVNLDARGHDLLGDLVDVPRSCIEPELSNEFSGALRSDGLNCAEDARTHAWATPLMQPQCLSAVRDNDAFPCLRTHLKYGNVGQIAQFDRLLVGQRAPLRVPELRVRGEERAGRDPVGNKNQVWFRSSSAAASIDTAGSVASGATKAKSTSSRYAAACCRAASSRP